MGRGIGWEVGRGLGRVLKQVDRTLPPTPLRSVRICKISVNFITFKKDHINLKNEKG